MQIDIVAEHVMTMADPAAPEVSGDGVHVGELSAALAAQGHGVTIWTRRADPDLFGSAMTPPGVTVRLLGASAFGRGEGDDLVAFLPALAEHLRQAWSLNRPDVVHTYGALSGLAARAAATDVLVPLVHTFHAVPRRRATGIVSSSRSRGERQLARAADHVIATCRDDLSALVRAGVPRTRVTTLPGGVDAAWLSPDGPAHPRGDRPRLVVLDGLMRHRGADAVVAALASVPAAELVIVVGGGAPDLDVARLRSLAARFRVAERVSLIGSVGRGEVAPLLRSAEVVVCVPWSEPSGTVALAAMACGRPVVASAVGGLVDTVVDGVTGLLVPAQQPKAIASALRRLLASPATGQAFGAAGRDRVESRYRWDRIAEATAGVYRAVAGSPTTATAT